MSDIVEKQTLDEMLSKLRISLGRPIKWTEVKWGDLEVVFVDNENYWYFKYEEKIYRQPKENKGDVICYSCGSEISFITIHKKINASQTSSERMPYNPSKIEIPYCMECDNTFSG